MRTNLEKFNHYKAIVDKQEQEFVDSVVSAVPEFVYEVYPSGRIRKLKIENVEYYNGIYWNFNKRPSKKQVEEIKELSLRKREFSLDKIRFNYQEIDGQFNGRGAFKLTNFIDYLTLEQADIKSKELKAEKAHEEELLKNAHIRCSYCSKVVHESVSVSSKIIFQNSRQTYDGRWKKFVDSEVLKFCSSGCAASEQMAREG